MRKITLESIKESNVLYQNGEYVVVRGAFLWIFKADGTFVAKKQNIRWPRKVAFLPDNRVIVQGGTIIMSLWKMGRICGNVLAQKHREFRRAGLLFHRMATWFMTVIIVRMGSFMCLN